jgi:hypothetical protein
VQEYISTLTLANAAPPTAPSPAERKERMHWLVAHAALPNPIPEHETLVLAEICRSFGDVAALAGSARNGGLGARNWPAYDVEEMGCDARTVSKYFRGKQQSGQGEYVLGQHLGPEYADAVQKFWALGGEEETQEEYC